MNHGIEIGFTNTQTIFYHPPVKMSQTTSEFDITMSSLRQKENVHTKM